MSTVAARLGAAVTHPIGGPLVVGGVALVVGAFALLLFTFWFLFSFVWLVPIGLGIRQVQLGVRVAHGPREDLAAVPSAVRPGLVASVVTLNPVAFLATRLASQRAVARL